MATRTHKPKPIPAATVTQRDGITFVDTHAVKCAEIFNAMVPTPYDPDYVREWAGCSHNQMSAMLAKGDADQIKRAREFSKELERSIPQATVAPVMAATVAGGAVNVPAYLNGKPQCFVRPVRQASESNPIRVFVDFGCQAGIKKETVEKRGLAILAFAQYLSKSRPVELIAFNYTAVGATWPRNSRSPVGGKEVVIRLKFGLRPVNWAMAAAIIGHAGYRRLAAFAIERAAAGKAPEYRGKIYFGTRKGKQLREALGCKDEDVVFTRGMMSDELLTSDTVGWVKRELDRIGAV